MVPGSPEPFILPSLALGFLLTRPQHQEARPALPGIRPAGQTWFWQVLSPTSPKLHVHKIRVRLGVRKSSSWIPGKNLRLNSPEHGPLCHTVWSSVTLQKELPVFSPPGEVLLDYLAWRGGGGVAGNTWISKVPFFLIIQKTFPFSDVASPRHKARR